MKQTQDEKRALLDLVKKTVTNLSKNLDTELHKITLISSKVDNEEVFINCDKIIEDLQKRLNQIKSTFK